MNREIKFRLPHFHANNGSFSHFSYWGTFDTLGKPSLDHGCFVSPSTNSGSTKGWHEQFTGLQDKNGKGIYEGDIVKYSVDNLNPEDGKTEYIEDVSFQDGGFCVDGYAPVSIVKEFEGEVIGNVHENFDLLEH